MALECLKESLKLKISTIPSNHPSIAVTLGNIAVMYCKLEKYDEALKSFNDSLKLYKETYPANHHLIALQVCNIAGVNGKLGKFIRRIGIYISTYLRP